MISDLLYQYIADIQAVSKTRSRSKLRKIKRRTKRKSVIITVMVVVVVMEEAEIEACGQFYSQNIFTYHLLAAHLF